VRERELCNFNYILTLEKCAQPIFKPVPPHGGVVVSLTQHQQKQEQQQKKKKSHYKES
jgi:hypothetical protein